VIHTDRGFNQVVEEAVRKLEERTDAEVVVVAAGRSGSYRDAAFAGASAITLLLLLVMLYVPYTVPPWAVFVESVGCWALWAWLLDGAHTLRLITTRDRRLRQVRRAANAEFTGEGVHATPQHTGVLVYLSGLEGGVVVLADVGIEGRVPRGEWLAVTREFPGDDLDHFLHGLERLGEVLARYVPPRDDPNRIELSDAPRIRP
jgi:putative membrane protein